MNNLTFGENSFTKGAEKPKEEKPKTEVVKPVAGKKEVAEPSKSAVILSHLEKLHKEQTKILVGMKELYENYATNQLSVAMNSVEMVIDKLEVAIDDVKAFGK